MEEFRDERLSKIMTWMQSWIRGYISRKEFVQMQEQRLALQVVQRNLRKYLKLRTWPWWKLWQKVKPLLNVSRIEDEIAVSINFQKNIYLWLDCTIFIFINHRTEIIKKYESKIFLKISSHLWLTFKEDSWNLMICAYLYLFSKKINYF